MPAGAQAFTLNSSMPPTRGRTHCNPAFLQYNIAYSNWLNSVRPGVTGCKAARLRLGRAKLISDRLCTLSTDNAKIGKTNPLCYRKHRVGFPQIPKTTPRLLC